MRYRRRPQRSAHIQQIFPASRQRRTSPFILVLLGFFVLFSVIIGMWWWLTPSSSPLNMEKNIVLVPSVIDDEIKQIFIINKSHDSRRPIIYALPAGIPVTVRDGYGEYPLVSLVPLLQLDKKDIQSTRAVMSLALGIPVHEVWTSGNAEIFSARSGRQIAPHILTGQIVSTLSYHQKGEVFFDLWRAAEELTVLENTDQLLRRLGAVFPAARQSCRIALVNASGAAGQAALLEKYLTKNGARVIRLDDQSRSEPTTRIYIQEMTPECQDVLTLLQTALPFVVMAEQGSDVFAKSRAEMHVVLGADMANF